MDDYTADALNAMEDGLARVKAIPATDETTPDIAGRIAKVVTGYGAVKRDLLSEGADGQQGDKWELYEDGANKFSFSESAIFADLMGSGNFETITELILAMKQAGALKLTFGVTKLGTFFQRQNVMLKTSMSEITDGDEAHIGKVWKSAVKPRLKPEPAVEVLRELEPDPVPPPPDDPFA